MRTLIVGALAATLVGCSCYVSPQTGFEACTVAGGNWFACFDRTAVSQVTEPEPASTDADLAKPRARSKIAARTERPRTETPKTETARTEKPKPEKPSARAPDKNRLAAGNAEPAAAATQAEPAGAGPPSAVSSPPPEVSDPVFARARMTVAAKLEDPASAEFGEMKRAMRTNMLGQSVDTVCGSVNVKKASGEGSSERAFLYLVKDNEAYVVDGPPASPAATAFRNICN